ncbi:glutamate--tRNA ligase [soil metagenome]
MSVSPVRCRFAPAPSGSLHVGNVRSALFSWLFARHQGGTFVLRVEDTDASRVTEEAVAGVLEDLRWLGLDHDEGPDVGGPHAPYRQSQRLDIYREHADRLLAQGDAYRCYCSPTELEQRRAQAMAEGEAPGYDGHCRSLTAEQVAVFEAEGRPSVVRFHMPDREWVVDDIVKGEVRFAPGQLRDFVLLRSDGSPVFLLAVAVDDLLMGITHVVRGDDLLASAPRNAAVIQALGGTPPRYAHVPQVLGPDRQPLSKRHGSTSVESFREQGYLPEAIVNYLALLGWSPGDDREELSREELIAAFDLERVSSNPAAFDTEKLTWLNNRSIHALDDDDLAARCLHFLTEEGLMPEPRTLKAAMPLVKERMKTLTEAPGLLRFLFTDDLEPNDKALALVAKAPAGFLGRAAEALEPLDPWAVDTITAALDTLATREELSRTKAFQPVRAAVTGSNVSPPLPESLALLGRERTLDRLRSAGQPLAASPD